MIHRWDKGDIVILKDKYIGILGMIISIFLGVNIWGRSFQTKAFPVSLLIVLFVLSLILICRKDETGGYKVTHIKKIVQAFLLIAIYIVCMKVLGWLSSTILFVGIFLWMYKCKMNKLILIAFAIGYPTVIYFVFNYLLAVRLPSGLLI